MNRTLSRTVAGGAIGLAGLLGIGLALPSLAAGDDDAATTTTSPDGTDDGTGDDSTSTDDSTDGTDDGLGRHGAGHGGHGHGGHGGGMMGGPGGLEPAATALGMTTEELLTALQGGSTLGEVADAEGVDRQTVVDALLAAEEERITAMLDRSWPDHGPGMRGQDDGSTDDSTDDSTDSGTDDSGSTAEDTSLDT